MSKKENFSRCSNGHIIPYGAEFCPWCGEVASNAPAGSAPASSPRAEDSYVSIEAGNTIDASASASRSERQTIVLDKSPVAPERTVVMRPRTTQNVTGRIVGFLVTYDQDPLGTS